MGQKSEINIFSFDPSSRWNAEEARQVVDAWKASGSSAVAFCEAHGIRLQRLYYWSRRLSRLEPPSSIPGFVRLSVTNADLGKLPTPVDRSADHERLEFELPENIFLRVPLSANAPDARELVRELLGVLR